MSRHMRPTHSDSGLARFAAGLRALRDAMGEDAPSVTDIAISESMARSTLYAALSGKRLPSRKVVAVLARSWGSDPALWLRKRSEVEIDASVLSTREPDTPTLRQVRDHDHEPRDMAATAETLTAVVEHDLLLAHHCDTLDAYRLAMSIVENRIMPMFKENERLREKLQALKECGH